MIRVEGLRRAYGQRQVLDNIHVTIPSKQVTFLAGANGVGKTTFLKCLLDLEPHQGQVFWGDLSLRHARDDVIAIFDDTPFYPHISGLQNLTIALGRVNASEAVRLMGGAEAASLLKRHVAHYSTGERKRLGLTWACLARPKYVLLDEIAGGLDLEGMDTAVTQIETLAQVSTVIATGHQFSFYERIASNTLALIAGKVETLHDDHKVPGSLENAYRSMVGSSSR